MKYLVPIALVIVGLVFAVIGWFRFDTAHTTIAVLFLFAAAVAWLTVELRSSRR